MSILNTMTGQPVENAQLQEISDLLKEQLRLSKELDELEERQKALAAQHQQLSEVTIPELMLGIGLQQLKLDNGIKVDIQTFYNASIVKEHEEQAFDWFRAQGHGSLIKRNVTCQFGMGEDEKAKAIVAQLQIQGLNPIDKTSIHPMTLKSFVREQVESGHTLPENLVSVFIGKRTKLTLPK